MPHAHSPTTAAAAAARFCFKFQISIKIITEKNVDIFEFQSGRGSTDIWLAK